MRDIYKAVASYHQRRNNNNNNYNHYNKMRMNVPIYRN